MLLQHTNEQALPSLRTPEVLQLHLIHALGVHLNKLSSQWHNAMHSETQ